MAESSRFWTTNNTGDGPTAGYSSANFTQFIRESFMTNTATEGVLYGIGNALAVSGTSSPVAVNTGAALVYGFYYTNDASVNVTIPTPATNPRIDRIVLRVSWAAQTVRITRIAGTENASPSAPSLTQVANTTWDIPLAQARITTGGVITVTDERTFIKHPGVYGWLNTALSITGPLTVTGGGVFATGEVRSDGASAFVSFKNRSSSNYWGWYATADIARLTNSITDLVTIDNSGNISAGGLNASQLNSGTVPAARITAVTADSIDDTMVGNRVPQFYRRQGGSATDWDSAGTTTYTPGMVRMQSGVISLSYSSESFKSVAVTFPTAFSAKPLVICGIANNPTSGIIYAPQAQSISTSGFTAYAAAGASISATVNIGWIAIGTE